MALQSSIRRRTTGLACDGASVARLDFITAIPQDVRRGSGCLAGIQTLAKGLAALECDVALVMPGLHFPAFSLERIYFNECLRFRSFRPRTVTVGFDADGYSIAGRRGSLHVASIKGVIADVLRARCGAG